MCGENVEECGSFGTNIFDVSSLILIGNGPFWCSFFGKYSSLRRPSCQVLTRLTYSSLSSRSCLWADRHFLWHNQTIVLQFRKWTTKSFSRRFSSKLICRLSSFWWWWRYFCQIIPDSFEERCFLCSRICKENIMKYFIIMSDDLWYCQGGPTLNQSEPGNADNWPIWGLLCCDMPEPLNHHYRRIIWRRGPFPSQHRWNTECGRERDKEFLPELQTKLLDITNISIRISLKYFFTRVWSRTQHLVMKLTVRRDPSTVVTL